MQLFFVAAHELSEAFGLPLRLGYLCTLIFLGYVFARSRRSGSSWRVTGLKMMIAWVYLGLISSIISNDVWTWRKVGVLIVTLLAISLYRGWKKKQVVAWLSFVIGASLFIILTFNILEVFDYAFGSLGSFSDVPRASPEDIFVDLRIWTFNLSDCPTSISDLGGNNHCAAKHYVFDYPRYILYPLRYLGLRSNIHLGLGVLIGVVAYILSAGTICSLARIKGVDRSTSFCLTGVVSLALMISLPLRYAVERGQIDLIIYNVFCFYYLCRSKGWIFDKDNSQISRYLILAITALIKIYSLVSLMYAVAMDFVCLFLAKKFNKKLTRAHFGWSFAGVLLTVICSFVLVKDIYIAKEANSFFIGGHGFGFSTLLDAAYSTGFPFSWKGKLLLILASTWIGFNCSKKLISSSSLAIIDYDLDSGVDTVRPFDLKSRACAEIFIMIAPFIITLYLFVESINYKLIMLILTLPLWIYLLLKDGFKEDFLGHFCILQLSALICRFLLLSIPFDPSQYLYLEWLIHFFCDPVIIGGACSMVFVLSLGAFRRVIVD